MSFVVRCWLQGEDERRIKVEHIQSGQGMQVTSIAAAMAWIDTCCRAPSATYADATDQSSMEGGDQ